MDSLIPMDLATLIQAVSYLGIFLIVFADSGVLLGLISPGDSLLFTAGLLASQGHLNLWLLMLVAALGAILGDSAGYAFGKRMGPQLFTRKASWLCTTRHLDHERHFYACHGGKPSCWHASSILCGPLRLWSLVRLTCTTAPFFFRSISRSL
jgi:membrane-associated protein